MHRVEHLTLQSKMQPTSSRILYDIPCRVCQDHSSGKHYGIFACDGCAGFFKRSIRRNRQYVCKAKSEGSCVVDKTHRNQCRACRLRKCLEAGMNKDAVQHERGPRNSTLRRQMGMFMKDTEAGPSALDLAVPKPNLPPPTHKLPPPPFIYPPPLIPKVEGTLCNPESVCESAARLLFMNVRWAKNVPAFTGLPMKDQLTLLEESWRELFIVGWAQLLPPPDLVPLAAPGLLMEAAVFQDTLAKLRALRLDHHEFACLRAILLFKTALEGEGKNLLEAPGVGALQDHTQMTLSKYVSTAYPEQPFRLGKLLMLLPALRAVSPSTIEELFFRRTIGPIPIERIISDMYKSNKDI